MWKFFFVNKKAVTDCFDIQKLQVNWDKTFDHSAQMYRWYVNLIFSSMFFFVTMAMNRDIAASKPGTFAFPFPPISFVPFSVFYQIPLFMPSFLLFEVSQVL